MSLPTLIGGLAEVAKNRIEPPRLLPAPAAPPSEPENVPELRVLVAAGGSRSGSTLQYNLVGEYLEHAGLGQRLGWVPPDHADQVVEAWMREGSGIGIAKCHHVVLGFHSFGGRDEAWAELIARGGIRALTTSRPQADIERSMCRKFELDPAKLHESPEWLENAANIARWRELGGFDQEFEDLTRHPVRALRVVVEVLGIRWSKRAAVRAALATRRGAMIRHQRRVPTGTWHPLTLIHWNHIDLGVD